MTSLGHGWFNPPHELPNWKRDHRDYPVPYGNTYQLFMWEEHL
jgi:hypothetical protein